MLAAVAHGHPYRVQPRTREQADRILPRAMEESGVSAPQHRAIHRVVTIFGEAACNQTGADRAGGPTRFVPVAPDGRIGIDAGTAWERHRRLSRRGDLDRTPSPPPPGCAAGGGTAVASG